MKISKGHYENGKITLLEEPPSSSSKSVLVTFFDENDVKAEDENLRKLSMQQSNEFIKNYLEDKREDLYSDL